MLVGPGAQWRLVVVSDSSGSGLAKAYAWPPLQAAASS